MKVVHQRLVRRSWSAMHLHGPGIPGQLLAGSWNPDQPSLSLGTFASLGLGFKRAAKFLSSFELDDLEYRLGEVTTMSS
uniref:Uncharacterized protein n=1 Tax=Cannabis sativa TaxID=3483 RepID=A0A803P963_CANSA